MHIISVCEIGAVFRMILALHTSWWQYYKKGWITGTTNNICHKKHSNFLVRTESCKGNHTDFTNNIYCNSWKSMGFPDMKKHKSQIESNNFRNVSRGKQANKKALIRYHLDPEGGWQQKFRHNGPIHKLIPSQPRLRKSFKEQIN